MGRRIAALLVFVAAAAVAHDKPFVTLKLVTSGMKMLKTYTPGKEVPVEASGAAWPVDTDQAPDARRHVVFLRITDSESWRVLCARR